MYGIAMRTSGDWWSHNDDHESRFDPVRRRRTAKRSVSGLHFNRIWSCESQHATRSDATPATQKRRCG
jgi:hypothetical protein